MTRALQDLAFSEYLFINVIPMVNRKTIFTNSVKIKFAHIASILRYLESKCFMHLESLILSHLELFFSQIVSIFTFNVIFSHLAIFHI